MSFLNRLPDQQKSRNRQQQPAKRNQKPVRYWPGKAPAPEIESDDEDEADEQVEKEQLVEVLVSSNNRSASDNNVIPLELPEVPVPDAVIDRRLRRLQLSKQHNEDKDDEDEKEEGQQRRQIEHITPSQNVDEEEEEEEEPAATRREKAREIARARRQKEEEEALAQQNEEAEEETEADDSSEYTSESDEEESTPMPLFKPLFVPKNLRVTVDQSKQEEMDEEELEAKRELEREERKKEAHNMIAQELMKEQAEAAAAVKSLVTDVDDTDGIDEEAEFEAWKLRELLRIKRDRTEAAERAQEEADKERRRNMTDAEIVAENVELNPNTSKKKQRFMQKYFHKGAFYQEDAKQVLETHDFSQPTLEDRFDKTILPEVMQVKNFGRAGRTKWKHLVAEDTTVFDAGWAQKNQSRNKRKRPDTSFA